MTKTDTIGIYMPSWLRRSEKSNQVFFDELQKSIKSSGRYAVLWLNLPTLSLLSKKDEKKFANHNLVLIVQHDSHYYSKDVKYKHNISWLEKRVSFLNPITSHEIGHNKISTKNTLRNQNLPVLDDFIVRNVHDLKGCMSDDKWYVIKPTNEGGGTGVKLIRKNGEYFSEYRDGKWSEIQFTDRKLRQHNTDVISYRSPRRMNLVFPLLSCCLVIVVVISQSIAIGFLSLFIFTLSLIIYVIEHSRNDYIYDPMLVEPYFNDDRDGFSSLRCTVIGDAVVEAVKRVNRHNITSNISHGGKAVNIVLTPYQTSIAVAAARAIGAECAGVDLLVCGDETVIGEINIGPVTLFCEYTGVNVGKILGEYLVEKCDRQKRFQTSHS